MKTIDHLILSINDIDKSVEFYVDVMGFTNEGKDGPFTVIRVSDDLTLQMAPWGTKGGEHYAFAMSRDEFNACFQRLKERGLPYGDSFHNVGTNTGPGHETGARGTAPTLYFNDPSNHLIEIRTYD
jgi:catechol 2,3-dioxygenase-like lactoylglutathione lyase family enzyme